MTAGGRDVDAPDADTTQVVGRPRTAEEPATVAEPTQVIPRRDDDDGAGPDSGRGPAAPEDPPTATEEAPHGPEDPATRPEVDPLEAQRQVAEAAFARWAVRLGGFSEE